MKKWGSLFSAQFLGVLNDNLLKNLIVFIGVSWVGQDQKSFIIGIAGMLLVVSYLFFSQFAGKLATEFKKVKVLRYAKLMELPIMLVAISGFYLENIWVSLLSVLLMGLQSALYSPSKYGLIRDVGGLEKVSFGNGSMELLQFVGILIGTMLAGFISDLEKKQFFIISISLLVFALLGYLFSLNIRVKESEVEKYSGSVNPLRFFLDTKESVSKINGLGITILGLGGFWFIGALLQMTVLEYMPMVFNYSNTETSIVMALVAIGIGLGCYTAGLLSKNHVELGLVPMGGIGLVFCLVAMTIIPMSGKVFTLFLILGAFFSGWFKVPLNSWIQERVEGRFLGDVLAYTNMVVFSFILLASGLYMFMSTYLGIASLWWLMLFAAIVITVITLWNVPAMFVRFICYALSSTMYSIKVKGLENVPKKSGALLVANHLSLVDGMFIAGSMPRRTRFVMLKGIYEAPILNIFFKKMNVIPVDHRNTKNALEAFNKRVQDEINAGHIVCIFAEGELSRIANLQGFKKGMEFIGKGINAPIIPLHMDNLEEAGLVYNVKKSKMKWLSVFNFRRRLTLSFGRPESSSISAFDLRTNMLELAHDSFVSRYPNLSQVEINLKGIDQVIPFEDKVIREGYIEVSGSNYQYLKSEKLGIYLCTETPDFNGKDLVGKPWIQKGSKKGSVGRFVPGVAGKVVKEDGSNAKADEFGHLMILINGKYEASEYEAKMDKDGFVFID